MTKFQRMGRIDGFIAMLVGSTILATSPALAQSAPPSAQGVAGDLNGQLEDIVVTAQRRTELAQGVPISITAVSGATLQAASVKGLDGLTKGIVGIQYDSGSTQRPELYIRGIGTNRFDLGSDPSSGIFIDEVYQPRFANVSSGLLDIERVEILRGPQGTLFGRNTIGGAISVTTADPANEFEGLVSGSYGNNEYVNAAATVSGPLTDRLRARISAGYSDRDGFMRDTVSGRDDGVASFTVRAKAVYDLTDNLTFKLSGSYFESRQRALLLNPASLPLFLGGPLTPQVLDGDPFSGTYTFPGGNRVTNGQINARLEWRGDALTTTLIGSWIRFTQRPSQDLDGNRNDNIDYAGYDRTNTYSAELRLASTDEGALTFNDRFRWVAGLFLFQDKGFERQDFTTGRDSIISFLIANPTLTPPFNGPTVRKTDTTLLDTDLTSFALYGQGTVSITDRLGLTIGGRYTRDRRDFTFRGLTPTPGIPLIPANYVVSAVKTSPKFTPRVSLDFKPVKDVLIYASYSQGFKSSAIQSTPTTAAIAARVTEPEKVDAYEIGLKSELFGRRLRLNIAVFENRFRDLQVRRVVTFPGGFSTALSENAATSTVRGLEVEASALVARKLLLNASYAYLDAKYGSYVVDPVAGIDFSGNRLPRAPRHRFNVDATYTTEIAGAGELQVRAAYNYTGEFFFQPNNLRIERESPYGLTDLSARLTLPNGTTSVQAWSRNLFNVTYRNYLDPLDQERVEGYGERRTYGVTVTQRF